MRALNAVRGDASRLEAFSDGVMAIAVTLLVLDVRVEPAHGQTLAGALRDALPQIGAFAASFLQIGIIWANHHALFRVVAKVDQLLLLLNLLLLGWVSFLPLPTRLIAEHTHGADAQTATLLYTGTLAAMAATYNVIWRHVVRAGLLDDRVTQEFLRDVDRRYLVGIGAYVVTVPVALVSPLASVLLTVALALLFAFGPSPRGALEDA